MESITVNRLANSGRDEKLLIISIFQLVSPSLRFEPGLKPPYNQPQIYFFIVKERNLHYEFYTFATDSTLLSVL